MGEDGLHGEGILHGLLIRAKCAPHFRRILYQMNPTSPLLKNYAHGSCPAGKYYCRITPEGEVTPPLHACLRGQDQNSVVR